MKYSRHQKDVIPQIVTNETSSKPYPPQTTTGDSLNVRQLLACIYPELTRIQRLDIHDTNKAFRRDRRRHR
jgi:hypothetical protein